MKASAPPNESHLYVRTELMNDPPPDLIRAWLLATYYDRGDTGTRKRQADIWSAGAESERERKIIRVALNMADAQAALTLRNATVVDLTMGTGEAATTTPRPDVFAMQQKVKSLKDATKEAANKSAVEFGFVTLRAYLLPSFEHTPLLRPRCPAVCCAVFCRLKSRRGIA